MKTIKLISTLLLCAAAGSAMATPKQFNYVKMLAQQIDFAEQHQTEVWPGFHPGKIPTVIAFNYDEQTQTPIAYALNFKPNALAWEKSGISNSAYYLANASVLDIFSSNGDESNFKLIDGNNSYTVVEGSEFIENENLGNSFMRERAGDYIKDESSIDKARMNYLTSGYAGFNNIDVVKLIYLEDAALTVSQSADAEHAEKALQDAVAIHQFRNQFYNNQAERDFENGSAIMMGIPVYIALTSQQLNPVDYAKLSQRSGCSPMQVLIGNDGIFECVIAGFPAYSTSVYGKALDQKVTPLAWKQRVESQFKSAADIAIEYYHFSNMQVRTMTNTAMQNPAYNYPRITKIVDALVKEHVSKMRTAQKAYKAAPGIPFQMDSNPGINILASYSFEPQAEELFHTSITDYLFTNITTIKDTLNADAPTFTQMPFMELHINVANGTTEENDPNSYTAFKLEDTAEIKIDGVSYTAMQLAQEKRTINFLMLEISDSHCHIVDNQGGSIVSSDGVLKLISSSKQARR